MMNENCLEKSAHSVVLAALIEKSKRQGLTERRVAARGNLLWKQNDTGCWEWQLTQDFYGYGTIWLGEEKRLKKAHRFVWEVLVGEISEGLVLDHLCLNKICVNPAHLEQVTPEENTRRGNRAVGEIGEISPKVDTPVKVEAIVLDEAARKLFSILGTRGGLAKSDKKTAACRANAKKPRPNRKKKGAKNG